MLAIVDGKPEILGLKQILEHSIEFQYEINTRKYKTLLAKDLEQKEIREGLIKACDMIDLIIEIIRGSQSLSQAKACLIRGDITDIRFRHPESAAQAKQLCFTERQAQAILDLRLAKLIGLEILQLKEEYEKLLKEIEEFETILSDEKAMRKVIIKDLEKIKKEYGFERRTEICDAQTAVFEEEKIQEQEVVFLMDRFGYAKVIDEAVYEKNQDAVNEEYKYVIHCMNTDRICIFTQNGIMHQIKVLKLPLKKIKDKGVPIDNLCNYSSETQSIIQVCSSGILKFHKMLFTTKLGMMKFVDASEFDVTKQTIAATKLMDHDEVISIDLFDVTGLKLSAEETAPSPLITGGEELPVSSGKPGIISEYIDPDDDQLTFEFIDLMADDEDIAYEVTDTPEEDQDNTALEDVREEKKQAITNKMIVIQTKDGVFLRFRLSEVPEKKKGAIGVRGINLGKKDEIDKIFIVGSGDKTTVRYRSKEVELMKLKLAKRGLKGTKVRV